MYNGPALLAIGKTSDPTDATIVTPSNPVPTSVPMAASATILSATTNSTGSNYTAFGSLACTGLDLVNNTGTAIEYRRGGAGSTMQIPNGSGRMIVGITNANQISVRRVDQSNTQVTVNAEALS